MIFKRRIIVSLVLLLSSAVLSLKDDFKFDNDDLQVVFTDPVETFTKSPSRFLYAKELSQCPTSESKLMLTLLLKSRSWRDLSEQKREKAIKKLSRFFAVPKEYLTVDDVSASEIYEMVKHSINKSSNLLNTKQKIGRVEFPIGCGDKMFATGKIIAHRITEQMKSGIFDDLTGVEFGWWNVWSKHVKSRVQRMKRAAEGGSGDEEEEDYDEYDGEGDEGSDNEEMEDITEMPSHTHRHQHGSNTNIKHKQVSVKQLPSVAMSQTQDIPEIPQLTTKDITMASETVLDVVELPVTTPINSIETPITPMDIDVAMRELESDVAKTIVDNINAAAAPAVVTNSREVVDEIFEVLLSKFEQSTSFGVLPTLPTTVEVTTMEANALKTLKVTEDNVVTTTIPSSTAEVVIITGTMTTTIQTETNFNVNINNNISNNNNNNYDDDKQLITSTEKTSLTTRSDDESGIEIESTLTQDTYQNTYTPTTSTPPVSTIVQSDELTTTEPSTTTIASTTQLSLEETVALERTKDFATTTVKTFVTAPKKQSNEDNYDEEYDDDEDKSDDNEVISPSTLNRPKTSTLPPPTTTEVLTTEAATTVRPTTVRPTTTVRTTTVVATTIEETTVTTQAPTTVMTSTESTTERTSVRFEDSEDEEEEEPINTPPKITNRLQKVPVTAGKPFVVSVPIDIFFDNEDGTNLKLELVDKNEQPLPAAHWIQFNAEKREIHGLPLEDDVSRWEFKLRATDSAGESVSENFDITVHQHKSYRSVNHEITLGVKLNKEFKSNVDWEVRLIRGITEALDDVSINSVVVREVRIKSDMSIFVYTNETLPKDKCPEEQLRQLMDRLSINSLNNALEREITVKTLTSELVGSCQPTAPKVKPIPNNTKNFAPLLRNPVDQVSASVGQLLVFKVPQDTFYDPEDLTDLKLTLMNEDRSKLDPNHWLQFDSKNHEFYGVPGPHDVSQKSYILIAEDKSGVTASDALQVVVTDKAYKREYNAAFEYQLELGTEQFNNAASKRKFIERVLQVFGDSDAQHILISSVKKLQYAGRTSVLLVNTTLPRNHRECPNSEIKALKNVLLHKDSSVRDTVKETIGNEFNVLKINMMPSGKCAGIDTYHHEEVTMKPEETEAPIITDDVLVTYVLPAAIILLMLLIALIIACILYKRRLTGKMELGDEEERKSFRSRGIPVIFQDELDEKPEIGNKSPIILKDEKPPLLPHYNGLNPDDHEDVDEYVPPQPLMMGSRESRGKSPVTPSYRKPPPYVSP